MTAEALAERLFNATVAGFDLAAVYLGDRLGWYRSLAEDGPATPEALASRTQGDARYAREWLEQQAVTGILEVDSSGRFSLPDAHREVLVEPESLNYMAPISRMFVAAAGQLPAVAAAFRSGGGVPWEAYGADMREGQAAMNRPAFTHLLGTEWIPGMPDVHERLSAGSPPARVADIACGEGWSTIALARAYPHAQVTGFDLDGPSIEAARANANGHGLDGKVEFVRADASGLEGEFDLAVIIEALHDMSEPVAVLSAVRGALRADGSLLLADERVAETFSPPGDDLERFMYGWSLTTCLPDGRSRQPSAATGTVIRPATVERYAREAGFTSVEVLPIENDFFRFYRLRP